MKEMIQNGRLCCDGAVCVLATDVWCCWKSGFGSLRNEAGTGVLGVASERVLRSV